MLPSFLAKDRACTHVCQLSDPSSRPSDRERSGRDGRGAPSARSHFPAGAPYARTLPPSYSPPPPLFYPSPLLLPLPTSPPAPLLCPVPSSLLGRLLPLSPNLPWNWLCRAQAAISSAAAAYLSAPSLPHAEVATTEGSAAPGCAVSFSLSSPGHRCGVSPPLLPFCSHIPLPAHGLRSLAAAASLASTPRAAASCFRASALALVAAATSLTAFRRLAASCFRFSSPDFLAPAERQVGGDIRW